MNTVFAVKKEMKQAFLNNGKRVPVTVLEGYPSLITQVKTTEKDGYDALQIGLGIAKQKRTNQPNRGHINKTMKNITSYPKYLREVIVGDREVDQYKIGATIQVGEVLEVGDVVSVTSATKGKGFTGVVKRWGFKGGPKTHGQSDRTRAPGSIGQGTTPGRVHKGKKMAGRSGNKNVTIKNIIVLKTFDDGKIWLKGPVPGFNNNFVIIQKIGRLKDLPVIIEESKKLDEGTKQ
jgi:large subunit ribosomal protein L3